MTLVNNPGTWEHIYPPLRHAEWHGWTHTDLVFPFFLFAVGVSMVFSFGARTARSTKRELALHVLRRSAIIILIGLFLNAFPMFHLQTLRYPGVLQRIGLCYLLAGLLYLYSTRRVQMIATAALLFGYWALMALVPVPGYGVGQLDPEGNLAAYVDRIFFTGHMWKPMWDPEGLLSTLPALATTLLGMFAGEWLRPARSQQKKLAGLIVAGVAGLALGELWNLWFPINKNLWTSSYVVFTAGYALLVIAVCMWLIDVRGFKGWAKPFIVFGTNAILLYVLSGMMSELLYTVKVSLPDGGSTALKEYIFTQFFLPIASPVNASLMFGLAYVLLWLGIMWIFYRKRIFIRI